MPRSQHVKTGLVDTERLEAEATKLLLAVETMVEWFHINFEAPESETHWDNNATWNDNATWLDHKEHEYNFGGPFATRESLTRHFSGLYDNSAITTAVERLEANGVTNWAPRLDGIFKDDSNGRPLKEFYGNRVKNLNAIDQMEIRKKRNAVVAAVDEIIVLLVSLPTFDRSIGHNQPPEDIGVPPYSADDRDLIKAELAELKRLVLGRNAKIQDLDYSIAKVEMRSEKIINWLLKRTKLFADESIKAIAGKVPEIAGFIFFHESIRGLIDSVKTYVIAAG